MQSPSQPSKTCAVCKTSAPLDALLCEECGRVFPLQSASAMAPVRMPASPAPRASPIARVFGAFVLISISIASGIGIHAWYISNHASQEAPVYVPNLNTGTSGRVTSPPGKSAASIRRGPPNIPNMAPNPQFFHAKKPPEGD